MSELSRRGFLAASAGVAAGALAGGVTPGVARAAASRGDVAPGTLHIGMVTYNLGRHWDIDTIIKNCSETKFEGVELRSTHAHGVESNLPRAKRLEVRKKFEDSPVRLLGLGTAFEFDSPDPAVVRKNIEGAKEYVVLCHDVGGFEIKVRPNHLHPNIPEEKTLGQIGKSLRELGEFAQGYGIKICLEIHGRGTNHVPRIRKILDYANHPNVWVTWNSNQSDLEDGGLESNFNLVKDRIGMVHMRDLYLEEYPWRKLLGLLRNSGYNGYCLAEIPESTDPIRVMKYYRALFLAYQDLL